jgi:cytidyltransferase-like protein
MNEQGKTKVVCCAAFDNMRAHHVRLLHEASRLGSVHVYLWDDATVQALTGQAPKFPTAERQYYLQSVRYVEAVTIIKELSGADALPNGVADPAQTWVVHASDDCAAKQAYCQAHGLTYQVFSDEDLAGFPEIPHEVTSGSTKKVLVTGCYDWFHTGHVRFFEEVSELGDLYVVVGHDANILELKGPGHPMFKETERRYLAGSIRYVKQALISSGNGWLDAEPEIERIKPDMYAVNEDGDKAVKREYCAANGIEYVVLKRLPKPGLTRRESTQLRGF